MSNAQLWYLVVGGCAAFVLWEVITGKTAAGRRVPAVRREEEPVKFWLTILLHAVVVVLAWLAMAKPNVLGVRATGPTRATQAAPESATAALRRRAFDLHRAQKYADAIILYDSLALTDKDSDVWYWRAQAEWKLEQYDLALQDARKAIDVQPDNYDAYLTADRLLSRTSKWDEIIPLWNRYIARNPGNAKAHLERGGTYYHLNDRVASLADAQKSCDLGNAGGCSLVARLK